MDEIKREFDPTDEYASIEALNLSENTNSNSGSYVPIAPSEPKNIPAQNYTPAPPQNPVPQSPYIPPQAPPQYQYIEHEVPMYPVQPPQYQQYPQQPAPYYQQPVVYMQPQQNTNPQNPYIQAPQFEPQSPYIAKPQFDPPKQKLPTGVKVYIGIMTGLMIFFLFLLIGSCAKSVSKDAKNDNTNKHPLSEFATQPKQDDIPAPSNQYGGSYIEEEIELQADEGHTQQGSDKDNTYPADKDAKDITTKDLPKDKDDKKYTTQYAYKAVTDSVVSIVCYNGKITGKDEDIVSEGTGTVITTDGYIVTNSHVIGDTKAYSINVIMNNAKEYRAKIVGFDSRSDLAVLKIDAKNLKAVTFADSDKTEVGQDIVAIGNPGGTSFQNSLTKGIVSAVKRDLALQTNVKYIQIDAAINPGNSGGPLCNIYGQVIGINTAKIADTAYEGMGFAIEGNKVLEIVNDIIKNGYVENRVRLGITGLEINYQMAFAYNLPYGILVTEIAKDGPLDNTDIKPYDIITEINGTKVSTFSQVYAELEKYSSGDKIKITAYRMEY